ncbi:MAG: ubiquinone/menaquinone biosynthesis methyltransferase [Acidimicrobiia bacterium]
MKSNNVLPQGEEKKKMVRAMFDSIAPTYEKANTYMTFGLDKYARKILVKELRIPQHSLILDLASGTGDFSRMFTKLGHDTLAVDLSFNMLKAGKDTKNKIQCDGTNLPFQNDSFDAIVCGYALRNFVNIDELIIELFRVLKPGGKFMAVDVSVPTNPIIKFGNQIWFNNIIPKIGRFISKNKEAYEYLPRSTSYLPSDDILSSKFKEQGFEAVRISRLVATSLIMINVTKPVGAVND